MVDRKLPKNYQKEKFPIPKELLKGVKSQFDEKELHLQEERRLFYVAITRAKDKLFITYAKRYGENKTDSKPSKFLKEIDYTQNPNINFQQADPPELATECQTKEKQTQTKLLTQIIASVKAENYAQAIESILLIAKFQNKKRDIKQIIAEIKEPNTPLEQVCEEKPVIISEGSPL